MSGESHQRLVVVPNVLGFHMRKAQLFVGLARRFVSTVSVIYNNRLVDGKSILELMTMGAQQGTGVLIRASGPDAGEAVETLADFVSHWTDDEES